MSSNVKHHQQKPTEKYKVIHPNEVPHLSHLQTIWNNRQQVSVCKHGISFDLVRQNGRVEGRGRAVKLNTNWAIFVTATEVNRCSTPSKENKSFSSHSVHANSGEHKL
jgi:hypothetical protein